MNIKGYVPHIFTSSPKMELKTHIPKRTDENYKTFERAFIQSGVDKEKFSFFAKLAEKESGFNANIQNSAGYPAWGYFQFMQGKYGNREWNNIEDIAGVDVNTFLNNPILQIQSADKLANKFLDSFTESDKRKARRLGYTDSALVAGAWLAGTGGVRKFLNGNGNPSDAHGTNVAQRMKEFNGYFKNGGILRFSSGGTGPGLDKALSDQVSFPTGSFGSNITRWSLDKLNRDYSYDIYRPHLEKIVDMYGDSLFVNDNSLSKREKVDFLYSLRGELSSLDIPKESRKDLSSLTKYFKNYIDSHTIGYKKESKLPDGSISTAYFDKNKKYLRREGARPKDLNEGIITINVDNDASKLNPHALAELYARYHGIPIARNGMKIKKCATGGMSPEGTQWVKDQNGAARYYKNQVDSGKSTAPFAPFYYRMRYGYDGDNGLYLPDGEAFAIVKNTYNGKPIVYSEIMQEGDRLVDYRNDPKKAYDIAIKTGNYLTVPSDKIANEFVSDYMSLTDWFPVFKGTNVGSVPATNTKSVDEYDISWEPDPNFVPTIEDLARQLTMSYEDYRSKPYILKTKRKDGSIFEQELIGHGIADPDIINKYRATGIPREVSEQWVINELNDLYKSLGKQEPNFYKLPWNAQLAILDAAYNTSGESFWTNSKNLVGLVRNGVTDPNKLVTELDHSKSAGGWLGDRSAARRALALGQFRWNWKYVDEFGRHYNPNIPLGSQDYLRALYLGNY